MEEKISVAEISRMREAAEEERRKHREIMAKIAQHRTEKVLTDEEQMAIVKRGNKTEITKMLEVFGESYPLSHEVQLYIYKHAGSNDVICEQMLKNGHWCLELEKEIINKGLSALRVQKKFSPQAEVYLLQQSLAKSQDRHTLAYLEDVENYLASNPLSPLGEKELMSYLKVEYGKDSLIDKCEQCVRDYILKHKDLCIDAQRLLIKSGNHNAIMDYIQESIKGLEAEDELLERGNRKEVETYFARYATM